MLKSLKIARPLVQMSSVRSYTRLPKLEGEARETALKQIPTWTVATEKDAIQKKYKFKDFKQAFAFMTKVADKAEEMNHHPEWFNVYNRVEVTLTTHDSNGLSQYDIDMAKAMDEYAKL